MTTQLSKLKIEEVSLVDFPATQLDGWLVQKARAGDPEARNTIACMEIIATAATPMNDSELLAMVGLTPQHFTPTGKANPSQHRGAEGRFRQHITGLTDRAAAPPTAAATPQAGESPSISDPPAEPITRSLFRPARGYRRIW